MSKIDLKGGMLWSSISQFGISGIQLISTIILARLLTPQDFGIIAPVAIFISVSNIIIDSGMGGFLVIKKNIDDADYSTLFLFNIGISLFLYFILYLAAPQISLFYNSDQLKQVIRFQSLTILINGFSIIYYINLLRAQQFKTLAIINFLSGIVSLIIAIFLGYYNFGVWALVAQQISFSLLYTLLLFFNFKYFPKLIFSVRAFKDQFSFGVHLLFANLLKTISDNINPTVVAKIAPLNLTGNFFQSSKIVGYCDGIAAGIIDRALFPAFAKIEDKKMFGDAYLNILFNTLSVVIPAVTVLSIFSKQITLLLLGNQWIDAGWMFGVLCFSLIPMLIQAICRTILKSMGLTKHILLNETVKSIAVLSLLLVASIFGIAAIVWSFVIAQIISALLVMFLVSQNLNYDYIMSVLTLVSLVGLAVLSFFLIEWTKPYLTQSNTVLGVLLKIIGFSTTYAVLFFLFKAKIKKLLFEDSIKI